MNIDQNIITIICEYSEPSAHESIARVCKRWHRAARSASKTYSLKEALAAHRNPTRMVMYIEDRGTKVPLTPQSVAVHNSYVTNYDSDGWSTKTEYSSSDLNQLLATPILSSNSALKYLTLNAFDSGVCRILCYYSPKALLDTVTLRFGNEEQPNIGDVSFLCNHLPAQRLIILNTTILQADVSNMPQGHLNVSHLTLSCIKSNSMAVLHLLALSSLTVQHLVCELPSSLETFSSTSLKSLAFYKVSGPKGTSLELDLQNFPSLNSCEIAECHCLTGLISKGAHEALKYLLIVATELHLYGECMFPNAKVSVMQCRNNSNCGFRCKMFETRELSGRAVTFINH